MALHSFKLHLIYLIKANLIPAPQLWWADRETVALGGFETSSPTVLRTLSQPAEISMLQSESFARLLFCSGTIRISCLVLIRYPGHMGIGHWKLLRSMT